MGCRQRLTLLIENPNCDRDSVLHDLEILVEAGRSPLKRGIQILPHLPVCKAKRIVVRRHDCKHTHSQGGPYTLGPHKVQRPHIERCI